MSKTLNAPQHIIDLLEEGIQATRMKNASFDPPYVPDATEGFTELVRERTRIYRETWVESPLLVVLAYLKGDIDAAHAKRLWFSCDLMSLDEDVRDPRIALRLGEG